LPVSETVLIKSADEVLPRLLLLFRISLINPRLKESHDFRATILAGLPMSSVYHHPGLP